MFEYSSEYYAMRVGKYELKIYHNGIIYYQWFTVLPKNINGAEWEIMQQELEIEMQGLSTDIIRKNISLGNNKNEVVPSQELYRFFVIKKHFNNILAALIDLKDKPKYKVQKEYRLEPLYRATYIDNVTVKDYLMKGTGEEEYLVPKRIYNYDLPENRWLKKIIGDYENELRIFEESTYKYCEYVNKELSELKKFEDANKAVIRAKEKVLAELDKYLETARRKIKYLTYIDNKRAEIETAREEELKCLRQQYYSIEQDIEHIESFSPVLFDRIPEDSDFLDLYLGVGAIKASKIIDYKYQEKLEIGDDLAIIPSELAKEYLNIKDAPVTIPLKEANAVGVVGKSSEQYIMMKNMLIDLVSRQYYGDLSIYVLLENDTQKYDWIKFLPYLQCGCAPRKIVCDMESKNNVFENLYKELTYRSESKNQFGYNVVFVMTEHGIKNHPISKFIEKSAELNTVFVFFEPNVELLPLHCSRIIEIQSENTAIVYEATNRLEKTEFVFSSISNEQMQKLIEKIAPVYCDEISLEGSLRKSVSLFELLGIYDVNDIDLKKGGSNLRYMIQWQYHLV